MQKEKQIKKLRKINIAPSVIFLILCVILAFWSFSILLLTFLSGLVEERSDTSKVKADSIIARFSDYSGDYSELISKMVAEGEITDSIYIFDSTGNVIASRGQPTFSKKRLSTLLGDVMDDKRMYIDISEDNLLNSKGDLEVDQIKKFAKDMIGNDDPTMDIVIGNAIFWIEGSLPDGERMMIRSEAPLYLSDCIKSGLIGLTIFGLFMVPVILFVINVIINFINESRMKKFLYTNTITGGRNFLYYEHNSEKLLRNRSIAYLAADITVMKYRSYRNYHGYHAGEELIEKIDKCISQTIGKREISALAAKSSFVLLLQYKDRADGEARIQKLLDHLTQTFSGEGIVFHAGIFFTDDVNVNKKSSDRASYLEPAECYSRASAARASLTDENVPAAAVYDDSLLEEQRWEHKVNEKMEGALQNNEFHVYVQPKYDPVTEKLNGAEALVRWINDDDGFISPGKFIPIFEKNGFITKLDDFMLDQVAKLQAGWLSEGREIVPISVNVSRAHFADPDLSTHICKIVDKYEVPHNMIEIELTESAFFDDKKVLLNTVNKLRELGFEISMDDFGAGYSSLNSLKDLPLDVLKLDADFFRGEHSQDRGEIVVAQAITLAKQLDMRIVAEGIENREQVEFLAKQGCDMIQGYYYAKPMPADEYAQRLTIAQ